MRAVWLTTNYGLDWPDKPYVTPDDISDQEDEMIDIIDRLSRAHFNTVFIQVRLRGNVIYKSKIEPLSPYIQGNNAVSTRYDPLSFAIVECHKRGIECHAWVVCYPMGAEKIKGEDNLSPALKKNKDKTKRYNGEFYLDPGNPHAQTYLLSIVEEILTKYDIDGVHLDYIRYPDNPADFPDNDTFRRYGKYFSDKNAWRTDNVNRLVYAVYDMVKYRKPWVQVSSSVLGFYDNSVSGVSPSRYRTALSVHQDPENWLQAGKLDFVVPMMYHNADLFFPFADDWQQRTHGRLLISGLGVYRLDEKDLNWDRQEITRQINYLRDRHIAGNALFRTRYLMNNTKGIMSSLATDDYPHPALLPPLTWLDSVPPVPPAKVDAMLSGEFLCLSWSPPRQEQDKEVHFNVYRSESSPVDISDPANLVIARVPGKMTFIPIDRHTESGYFYALTATDRYHNESRLSDDVFFVTGNFEK